MFIQFLPVVKLSGTAAKITIPKSQTGNVYWWAGASRWDGPAPCRRGCIDFAPNNFPDILHDMVLPVVTMTDDSAARVGELDGRDLHPPVLGLRRAFRDQVLDRPDAARSAPVSWTFVALGNGRGHQRAADHQRSEGTRLDYRVIAKDKQGNQKISPTRRVYIPRRR